jgi:hypothetical protein
MNRKRPYLLALAAVLILANGFLVYYAIHDVVGRRNTAYTRDFTLERYRQIAVGLPRAKVIQLLGLPFQTSAPRNYPVRAFGEERALRQYGQNAEVQIEILSFSRAKKTGDFEMVWVWIGPDNKVLKKKRWVTD